jgi:hypothetical protein
MAHKAQQDWVGRVAVQHPEFFTGTRVLEFGSYDINGSVRGFFTDPSRYVGVDHRAGPCVDVVSLFHNFEDEVEYDVFISASAFEHDPYWRESIKNGISHLRDGGLIVISCGNTWYAHELDCSPVPGYYGNVGKDDFEELMRDLGIEGTAVLAPTGHAPPQLDLQFTGLAVKARAGHGSMA